ncbi:MAG: type III pantothenate kinase [Muribaculaceae bacterium]|nr:type III pantothenate kinase [Muribaculaceae bacterium]
MAYFLTIDQGNSAAKLALWENDKAISHTVISQLTAAGVDVFVGDKPLRAALYCSVATEAQAVMDELKTLTHNVTRLSAAIPLPLKISYKSPCSLGADRIAAAAGAMAVCPGEQVLVVDIGTAVTYDVVTADGTFIGGNIAPGLKMRLDSLNRYTARLPLLNLPDSVDSTEPMLGTDTSSAMIRGALHGIAGAVSYYQSRLTAPTKVILTGGDARYIAPLCNFPLIVEEHLVDIGLNRILLYNEENK